MLLNENLSLTERASCFHVSLGHSILQQANAIRAQYGAFSVGLTGGVFQNRVLSELASRLLRQQGFEVYQPSQLPCNDGALSYGQIIEAGHGWETTKVH